MGFHAFLKKVMVRWNITERSKSVLLMKQQNDINRKLEAMQKPKVVS
jgi:hypothetical protein